MMPKARGFRLDMSSESGVVICIECGWRGFALDRLSAWRQAASHERRAHPGRDLASAALANATHRQAH